jgi:hypothetical protein
MSSKNTSSGGMSLFSVLTVVFVVLKLTDVIDWSWWLVLAPTWGGICLALLLAFIARIAWGE